MIHNDVELDCTQQRLAYFYRLLMQFRVSTSPTSYPLMAGAYLAEIELMPCGSFGIFETPFERAATSRS